MKSDIQRILNLLAKILLNPRILINNINIRNLATLLNILRSSNPNKLLERLNAKYEIIKDIPPAPEFVNPGHPMMGILQLFMCQKINIFLENTGLKFEFPENNAPKVSIILVLFNKAEYTYQCLETIKANADLPYEIILIDNASSDKTSELLDRIENANIIRNAENIGFLRACNQGARIANGEWLLFLNNDTQIMPSLLSTLLRTTEKIERCGAVGAKLIFPDGKLQEAGSIIWNDGSCLGYGRGDDPLKPEYSYVREVHYCSGACLFVKKELFKEAGMFDEQFSPAYYDEADICMKIREMGYKVVYQPSAMLIHYEFGSSSSVGKAIDLQTINRQIFVNKWKKQLDAYYSYTPDNIIFSREYHKDKKTRLLIIEDRVPDPCLGSGYPRTHIIIEYLSDLGYGITVFPLQFPEKIEPCTYLLQQKGIEIIYGRKYTKIDFKNFFIERKYYYDAIWMSRPHNMKELIDVIKQINPAQKVIYDAEALFSVREIMMWELEGVRLSDRAKNKMIQEEVDLMSKADVIISVSENERALVEKNNVNNVRVLGHSYNINPTTTLFDQRKGILFVGAFLVSPSPNEDAVKYFVNDIYPKVYQAIGAKLFIVGTNYLDSVKCLEADNIVVTGRVDNLYNYFDKCRVFVVPTRYSAGIPLKLQECLSFGLPAVVTPITANQLGIDENVVLIGNTADDFANKIIQCYTDENRWKSLRENGLKYIENECSPTAYKNNLNDIIGIVTN